MWGNESVGGSSSVICQILCDRTEPHPGMEHKGSRWTRHEEELKILGQKYRSEEPRYPGTGYDK